ncbi:MAG: hypothetical protein V1652_02995 [bacterium]
MEKIKHWFTYIFFDKNVSNVERILQVISYILRLSIIGAIITASIKGNWTVLFISTLALIVTIFPSLLARNYNIHLPIEFELFLTVFIYAALFLGEIQGFYTKFWWWDIVLHTASGIALGFIGFLILYTLYSENLISASAFLIAFFSFCFALALGTVWEIFEFSMDSFFATNMQKSGLVDTMWDLIVDGVGALTIATIGFFYIKKEIKGGFFHKLVTRARKNRPAKNNKLPNSEADTALNQKK